jgi:hypothetical protein
MLRTARPPPRVVPCGVVPLVLATPLDGPQALTMLGALALALVAASADRFPRAAAAAAAVAAYVSTEQYLWGLRRLLDGIAGP